MSWIGWALVAIGIVATLLVLDRVALWAERRGWIYYRHRQANPGTVASALQTVMSVWDPNAQHAADERRSMDADEAGDDDPVGDALSELLDGPAVPEHLKDEYDPPKI